MTMLKTFAVVWAAVLGALGTLYGIGKALQLLSVDSSSAVVGGVLMLLAIATAVTMGLNFGRRLL